MAILILSIGLLLIAACQREETSHPQRLAETATVVFEPAGGGRPVSVTVEVARTPEELERGLMHRQSLADDHGMLFVFDLPRRQRFWMKKTLIDLDIIFISRQGRIVSISANAKPCYTRSCPIYASSGAAQYVVEVNGGFAARHDISAGDHVRLPSSRTDS